MRPSLILLPIGLLSACGSRCEVSTTAAPTESDRTETEATFEEGVNGLFIGQSFFVPVARAFDELVDRADFAFHSTSTVFRGGAKGSPEKLWENDTCREKIEADLAEGDVELFGMTIGDVDEDNPAEFYGKWIDMALDYNPDTAIFIGFPYMKGGPDKSTADYRDEIVDGGEDFFSLVEGLREDRLLLRCVFIDVRCAFSAPVGAGMGAYIFSPEGGQSMTG